MRRSFVFQHYWRNIILFNLMAAAIVGAWMMWTKKNNYTLEFILWIIADIILYRGRILTFNNKGVYKHTRSIADLLISDISAHAIITDHEFIDFSNIPNLTIKNCKNKSVLIINYLYHFPIFDRSINRTLKINPKNYKTTIEELLECFPKNIQVIEDKD